MQTVSHLNFGTRSMLRSELVMIHMICNDGYLLWFYLNMTLTSSDTVWIMFKKKKRGFVLFLPKS
jgi:hypothetical protein